MNLKGKYSLFLFSQYSPEFLDLLSPRIQLNDVFPERNIKYSCSIGAVDLRIDFYKKIIAEKWIIPGKSVWIDADPHRTSASIRSGIDTIIFVEPKRLRREIALRGLLPLHGDE